MPRELLVSLFLRDGGKEWPCGFLILIADNPTQKQLLDRLGRSPAASEADALASMQVIPEILRCLATQAEVALAKGVLTIPLNQNPS